MPESETGYVTGMAFGVKCQMPWRWIRVSDRLPEPHADCWGTVVHPGINGQPDGKPHVEQVAYSPGGPFQQDPLWYNQISCFPTYVVTHWMPHVDPRWVQPDPAQSDEPVS